MALAKVSCMLSQAHLFASSVAYSRSMYASADISKISHTNGSKPDEPWENLAFPTYLQSEVDDFCQDWDEALQVPFQQIWTLLLLTDAVSLLVESWQFYAASPASHAVMLLQLEERRQSDASHRDATRKSRGAVTRDNPVWQAIRYVSVLDKYHNVNRRKHMNTTSSGNMSSASVD